MSITCRKYGELEGQEVRAYTLDNGKGLCAEILNYGGIITRLVYKGTDVALGWVILKNIKITEAAMVLL